MKMKDREKTDLRMPPVHVSRLLMAAVLAAWAGVACAAPPAAAAAPSAAPVAAPTAAPESIKGQVLEVKDAGQYTYLRLKISGGETWAAVQRSNVQKGAQVTIDNVMLMKDFESRALKRKFDRIVLGTLVTSAGASPVAATTAGNPHTTVPPTGTPDVKVAKATGADARTVAEIVAKRSELKDKPVVVRGKVVKYTPGVMGKNWIHLRDGSGSATERTNDVLVTTTEETNIGDVVTAKGVVRTDKDFGSGYAYQVLVEQATLQK
jgi:hypothetical protein